MPRRNKRKKIKYEGLRCLTMDDIRAFQEPKGLRADAMPVSGDDRSDKDNKSGGIDRIDRIEWNGSPATHPVYQSAIMNQKRLREIYASISPKRGEIWYVNLGEFDRSSVQRGVRPAVIISSDMANEKSGVVTVVPLTSKLKKAWYPSHIPISNDDLEHGWNGEAGMAGVDGEASVNGGGKPRKAIVPSQVLAEQLQTVDKQYLGKRVGKVGHLKMLEIEEGMRGSLAL